MIIEEFLEGLELSVECIVYKGKTTAVQYTEKIITSYPYAVELGHLQPAMINSRQKKEVNKVINKAIKSLRLDNVVCHPEVMITKEGVKMIEIGPRGGGDFISSYLTLSSCGVNLDNAIINLAFNEKPSFSRKINCYSIIKYLQLEFGKKVEKIIEYKEMINNKDVIFANISLDVGDVVEPISESKNSCGFVLVKASNREDAISIAEKKIVLLKNKIKLGDA